MSIKRAFRLLRLRICLQVWILVNGSAALQDVRLTVPEAVAAGEAAKLECHYNLTQEALYSVKWYRGGQEFYRFVPKESPPSRVFPQGIRVDLSQSNETQVTLRDVQRDLTGIYMCEVSADAPLFHTEIISAFMNVVELPTEKPRVSIEKLKYTQGERIRANCTAPAAYPAVNLTWFLNGKELQSVAPATWVSAPLVVPLEAEAAEGGAGPLEVSRRTVELLAAPSTFREGRARLRCLATLFTLYRQTEEVELVEDAPQIAPVMGPTAPHSLDLAYRIPARPEMVMSISITLWLISR